MTNRRNAIIAATLIAFGLAGFVWFLTGEGLDKAEKWISIVGIVISIGLGAAGVALTWLTWRRSGVAVPRSGVTASGLGATAIDGKNTAKINTEVSDVRGTGGHPAPAPGDLTASGHGSIAVRGDNSGDLTTKVTGRRDGKR